MHTTHSAEETKQVAQELVSTLKGGEFLALQGDLGAGKTTFTQGLAEALGVEDPVRSPTFTLMNIYKTAHPSIKTLVHLDCYRLGDVCDVSFLELEEWLNRNDVVIVMEWPPSMLKKTLGATQWITVIFEQLSEQERTLSIER